MKYQLIQALTLHDFNLSLERMVKSGWVPFSNVTITNDVDRFTQYNILMMKA